MKKGTLLIDLDGTLKTDYDNFVLIAPDAYIIESDGQLYRFLKRPYVDGFLKEAREKYDICLATFGKRDYAIKVLDVMGIRSYFDKLLTYENFRSGNIGNLGNFILIDNSSEMGRDKIEIIDKANDSVSILKDLIIVDTYSGNNNNNNDDDVLLKLIERI